MKNHFVVEKKPRKQKKKKKERLERVRILGSETTCSAQTPDLAGTLGVRSTFRSSEAEKKDKHKTRKRNKEVRITDGSTAEEVVRLVLQAVWPSRSALVVREMR